jgi:N-acetylglucosaminyl-diphospho-decaprenol L-rhamnosyltransferase
MTRSRIGIVVVTYSPGESLEAFLDSLAAATTADLQVILADNGSMDGVPERAAQDRANVTLLRTGGNLGYGRAANLGVAAADKHWVVIANPDITWAPGSLDLLRAAAARWPRAATVGPLIRTVDGDVYPSARESPSLGRGIGHALFGWWLPSNPWTKAYRREREALTERPAGWLSGSCMLVRRDAFLSVGGFDPDFFMYFEDLDLGERLAKAGWQNIYVPGAEVVHTGGHATRRNRKRMLVEHHRSAYRYLSRRYPGRRWLPLRLLIRGGLTARAAVVQRIPWEQG